MRAADLLDPLEALGVPIPDKLRPCVTRLTVYAPLTARRWAAACGVTPVTLRAWLAGAALPSPPRWVALRRMLAGHHALAGGAPRSDAALLAAYADGNTYSDACVRWLGMRPTSVRHLTAPELVRQWWAHNQPLVSEAPEDPSQFEEALCTRIE